MKFALLLSCLILMSHPLSAQLLDDFEDADLNSAPQWNGMLSSFTSLNGRLKSNHNTTNSVFYISTPLKTDSSFQWSFDVQLQFNTSSLNYVDAFLFSDSANLIKSRQGLFVRMGGSTDEVSLFKIINGVESKLIDGADAVLNTSNNSLKIRVTSHRDTLSLLRFNGSSQQWIVEGRAPFDLQVSNCQSGIRIRQSTSAFFGKHFFDNWYAGEIPTDTLPPVIDSLQYDALTQYLHIFWNEALDSALAVDTNAFTIAGQHPSNISYLGNRHTLKFLPTLAVNQLYQLHISGIKDVSENTTDTVLSFFTLKTEVPLYRELLITELMPDPDPVVDLPLVEYVEIYNASDKYLSLKNCRISDPTAFRYLPNWVLPPDSFLVLYQIPSLNNAADQIALYNPSGILIDQVNYDASWYADSTRDKGGYSLERIDLSNFCLGKYNWCASIAAEGGTPGNTNSVQKYWPPDTIAPSILTFKPIAPNRLYMETDEVFDSVKLQSLKLFIHQTAIPFSILYQQPEQRRIELLLPHNYSDTAQYLFYVEGFKDCPGNILQGFKVQKQFVAEPEPFDIVINEVLFNPRSGGHDFIELFNRSRKSFDASTCFIANYRNGAIANYYPLTSKSVIIKPGDYCLLSEDTAEIAQSYNCGKHALRFQMKLPTLPDQSGQFALVGLQNQLLDSLAYNDNWHFSLLADKNGVSLERLNPNMHLHLSSNWHSAAAVKGFATPGYLNSQAFVPILTDQYFDPVCRTLSPDSDGFQDLFILRYHLPGGDFLGTLQVFDLNGRLIRKVLNNQTLSTEGELIWDGLSDSAQRIDPGIYILSIDAFSPSKNPISKQFTVIVCYPK